MLDPRVARSREAVLAAARDLLVESGPSAVTVDAVVARWKAETSWSQRVSLAHALIGWTKGTGLMGHNDAIVDSVEEAGVTT